MASAAIALAMTLLSITAIKSEAKEENIEVIEINLKELAYEKPVLPNQITPGLSQKEIEDEKIKKEMEDKRRRDTIEREQSPSLRNAPSGTKVVGISYEQCVIFAKRVTGITKTIGYAGKASPEGFTPKVGVIALEKKYGHAMAVVAVNSDGILINESNFVKGKITERFIPYSDVRGYIY